MKSSRVSGVAAALCVAMFVGGCGGGADRPTVAAGGEAQTVSVGITSWHTWYWWLMAAEAEGLMEPYGVKLDVVTFQNTGQIAAAVLSGSMDIGLIAPEQTFVLQKTTPELKLIGSNIVTSPYTMLGAPGVKSVKDLRGATIGVTSEGSSADYFTSLLMLRSHGMKQGTDFDYVTAGPPSERAAAMQAGQLQAVMNFEPDALRLIKSGAKVLDRAANYDNLKGVEVNDLAATTTWYEKNRALAENFARGVLASIDWLYNKANRDRAEAILADRMKLDPEMAAATYDRFVVELQAWDRDGQADPTRLEQTRANAAEAGLKMPDAADLEGRFDNSIMKAAADFSTVGKHGTKSFSPSSAQ